MFYCPECDHYPTDPQVTKYRRGSWYTFYCPDCGGQLWTEAEIEQVKEQLGCAAELASLDRIGWYMEHCGG